MKEVFIKKSVLDMGLELWLDLDQPWSVIVLLEGTPLPRPKSGLLSNTQK